MAIFEQHCRDCERVLGKRHENVNHWMDELYRTIGPDHRKVRHHRGGVWEAYKLFGHEGAKAAIVHIVRDCGCLPREDYYDRQEQGIVIAPEYLVYDSLNETAWDKFKAVVEQAWKDWEQI